ncbi:MAG: C-GCAxxG-C-C family protein [Desulfobacterales bacterium]|nr:C-GCAxxG-C-C family protein [Desulfobacterales bacterium]
MQGLQEIWDIDKQHSWATAGYLGAINSGQTTCGLLISSSIAIGLRYGKGKNCTPMENEENRNKAVNEVNMLYNDFIHKFNCTICKDLTSCDFSKPEDLTKYMEKEVYKKKCFVFFKFVMNRFIDIEKQK